MDPVKRRLELLDLQLTPRHPIDVCSERMTLLMPSLSLILGILLESFLTSSRHVWLAVLIGSPLVLIRRGPHRFVVLACVMAMALGGLRLACYTHLPGTDISNGVTDQDTPATLTGTISNTPRLIKTDWVYASQLPQTPGQSFDLQMEDPYCGTVRVYATEPIPALTLGTHITVHGRVSRFAPAPNPGQFDMAAHQARRNCFVTAYVKSPASVEILPGMPGLWHRILRARSQWQQRMAETFVGPGQDTTTQSALLKALLLGVRSDVPSTTLEAFQTTGLLHLISLSGLHVGILMTLVWVVCQCLGLLKPARAAFCLCVLGGFLWLVPLRAATVRAGVIAGLFCLAILLRRKPHPANTLSVAALLLLLIRPTQLFEAGWQLSFSSVLGILLVSHRLESWSYKRFLACCPLPESPVGRIGHHVLRSSLTLLAVGLGAWLGSTGLLAYHFYCITPLSVLYTLITLPLVTLILVVGFVHILASLICPFILPMTLINLNLLCSGLVGMVHGLSLIPGSRVLLGCVSWMPVTQYYGLLLTGLWWKTKRVSRGLVALALILPLAWVQGPKLWQHRRPVLELTCLSVGHGQALLLHAPGRHTTLFDAGALYQKDIGRRIVSAYLDFRGILALDAIVASHNDADHMNGIPEILQHCHVARVYTTAKVIDQAQKDQGPAPWLQAYLQSRDRSLEPLPSILSPGQSTDGRLTIEQLWPHPDTATEYLSDNNASLVLLITYGDHTILLTSDIEQATQEQLIALYPDLQPDVLVAPHHGSVNTLSENFLSHMAARIILCSCSTRQFNRRRVISTPETYHTPEMGAITLCLRKDGPITVEGWLSPRGAADAISTDAAQ